MKKLAAILLMGVLLFNWCGYRLVSSYLEERADRRLEAALDNNSFDESQLITLKIPATYLAYYNNSPEFERVDGQIEIAGVKYKYVERRLFNDSLELKCIANHAVMKQQAARNEFFQLVNDLQHNGQGKKSDNHNLVKSFSPVDYEMTTNVFHLGSADIIQATTFGNYTPLISSTYRLTDEQPPDHNC